MDELHYVLRNDAAALAERIGRHRFAGWDQLGLYAGLTRGEADLWEGFVKHVDATCNFLKQCGVDHSPTGFHPGNTSTRGGFFERFGIKPMQPAVVALCNEWEAWKESYAAMHARQPILDVTRLLERFLCHPLGISEVGLLWMMDWAEHGCVGDPPLEDINEVDTPAFRKRLADVRAKRIGWPLSTNRAREYHLFWCGEEEIVSIRQEFSERR